MRYAICRPGLNSKQLERRLGSGLMLPRLGMMIMVIVVAGGLPRRL
tara:strand:+ start:437 stop:574 length:138 start_codon:yes stop_codon:yes gene_type:complete